MKMFKIFWALTIGLGLSLSVSGATESKYARVTILGAFANQITGQVWGPDGKPVPNIYVELTNEVNSTVGRQKTSNAGLYGFSNLSAGLFRVKILTMGTDYLEQIQEVQILNLVAVMSDHQYCDFHLQYDPMKVKQAQGSGGPADEVFVQEGVTPDAESHYKKGIELLNSKKSDAAIAEFNQAILLVPNYFYALNALGRELVERGRYGDAFPYLIKAVDINQRSYSSLWALAYALYQSKQLSGAIQAAKAAIVLKPSSIDAPLLLGTALRQTGNFQEAETALLKAKANAKNKMPKINWQLALLYNRMDKNKEAADELETFLNNEPDVQDRAALTATIEKLRKSKGAKIQ